MELSIVIPFYNERESLATLATEVGRVLDQLGKDAEVVLVDDGSRDKPDDTVVEICKKDKRFRCLHLSRNQGKSLAYAIGFEAARGSVIITLDGDLQDDPAEIPSLLKKLDKGYDLVIGWKKGRIRNEWYKSLPSRIYNRFKGLLFGISLRDSNSGFRAMTSDVAQKLDLYGDRYRFIPELSYHEGFRVAEIPVSHRKRQHGVSKYGPVRFYTGLMDLLSVRFVTLFASKPLHFFGALAMPLILIGGGLELYVLFQKLGGSMFRTHLAALIIGVLFLLVGFQFLTLGLIGEMLTSTSDRRELPDVRKITSAEDSPSNVREN